jgi:hypothetical protein
MGRWATYAKRGGGGSLPSLLPPPPAPILVWETPIIIQVAQGLDDAGGTLSLYFSADGVSNWNLIETDAWMVEKVWGGYDDEPGFYRATEVGNGTVYAGESDPSSIVEVEA